MTHDRNQQGEYPSSTQVPPGTTNPDPVREPWDPRREPQGSPMPWEDNDKDMQPKGEDQPLQKR